MENEQKVPQKNDSAPRPRARREGSFGDNRQRRAPRKGGAPTTEKAPTGEEGESPDLAVLAVVKDPAAPEIFEKVVEIKRVTKVTKGGKRLAFSALVVVGDGMGKVGYSLAKAGEVSIAIRKALLKAKRAMVKVNLNGSTITHEIIGQCGGSRVLLKPAGEGTGVIASGSVRAVCDGAGIRNILSKCHRSNNPVNVVKATFDGLVRLKAKISVN